MKEIFLKDVKTTVQQLEEIKTQLKRKLNTCKLTGFKSETECSDFYSVFFCNNLPETIQITYKDWFRIYSELLEMPTFNSSLIEYLAIYKPEDYSMLFVGLYNQIKSELEEITRKSKANILAQILTELNRIYNYFETMRMIIVKRFIQPETTVFSKTCTIMLNDYISKFTIMYEQELSKECDNGDPYVRMVRQTPIPVVDESAYIDEAFEKFMELAESYESEPLDEGIRSVAKGAASAVVGAPRKAEDWFDRHIFKAYDHWRKRKEQKNHEEMMGETVKLSSWIKRAFFTILGFGLFGPVLPIIANIVSYCVTKETKKEDRIKILTDIKDEIEITDEKIRIAESKGDDKAKIDMIRIRQKLKREYEKMSRGYIYKDPHRY